jgi:hypothetical protein
MVIQRTRKPPQKVPKRFSHSSTKVDLPGREGRHLPYAEWLPRSHRHQISNRRPRRTAVTPAEGHPQLVRVKSFEVPWPEDSGLPSG